MISDTGSPLRAVAVAMDLTPPVSARATTSATCATSDPSRSRCSPALRRSIAPVSSVIRHAKMRRRRFASIEGPSVSSCFGEDELCKRLCGSDRRELDERPRGYPPLITTRAALTDEVIERGHVPRAVHLEQRCDDGDGDGE